MLRKDCVSAAPFSPVSKGSSMAVAPVITIIPPPGLVQAFLAQGLSVSIFRRRHSVTPLT